jgi:hypothetical protein
MRRRRRMMMMMMMMMMADDDDDDHLWLLASQVIDAIESPRPRTRYLTANVNGIPAWVMHNVI